MISEGGIMHAMVNQSLWRQYLRDAQDDSTIRTYVDWLERQIVETKELKINSHRHVLAFLKGVASDLTTRLRDDERWEELQTLISVLTELQPQTEFNLGPMAKDGATESVAHRFAEQAATEVDFIEKFLAQMSHLEFEHESLDFFDKTLTLRFVEEVRRRLSESTEARILGYADSGAGIRWREDAGGYTGHLWSGPAESRPVVSSSMVEKELIWLRAEVERSQSLYVGDKPEYLRRIDAALAKLQEAR